MKKPSTSKRQSIMDAALLGEMEANKIHIKQGRLRSWDLFKNAVPLEKKDLELLNDCIELDTDLIAELLERI